MDYLEFVARVTSRIPDRGQIMGNVVSGGLGQAPTKQAAMKGGIPRRKSEPMLFAVDEGPREDTALEKLAKLRPAFKKDGTVTAGNASSLNDGVAAVVVASGARILTTLIYRSKTQRIKERRGLSLLGWRGCCGHGSRNGISKER